VLSKVSFRIELPEQDEMQLSVVGNDFISVNLRFT